MAASNDNVSMALFCDFENVALGVRDAKYEKFDIRPVLERLLAKGSIVVKKAYCDWERYKGFKAAMHEANFELIEIPHVRQSGKNSADIRMVVDALDLCYTKAHVDTFVIISGDSDFSPLVSKLRENAKQVIGVGVKQSTSDLLIANCDEFIFYDDLVREREAKGAAVRREQSPRRSPEEERKRREELEARKAKAIELAVATFEDLIAVRGDTERIWASVLKEAIKRRNPGFNESYYGYRAFGTLLEDAAARGLIGFGRDEKSGAYVTRPAMRGVPQEADTSAALTPPAPPAAEPAPLSASGTVADDVAEAPRKGRRRKAGGAAAPAVPQAAEIAEAAEAAEAAGMSRESAAEAAGELAGGAAQASAKPARRGGRKRSPAAAGETSAMEMPAAESIAAAEAVEPTVTAVAAVAEAERSARKPAARSRRPRKGKGSAEAA